MFSYFTVFVEFYQAFTQLSLSDLEQYYPIANTHFQQLEAQLKTQLKDYYQTLMNQKKITSKFSPEYLTTTTIFHVKHLVYGELSIAEKSVNELVKIFFDYHLRAIQT